MRVVYVGEMWRADPTLYKPNNSLPPLSIYVRHLLLHKLPHLYMCSN